MKPTKVILLFLFQIFFALGGRCDNAPMMFHGTVRVELRDPLPPSVLEDLDKNIGKVKDNKMGKFEGSSDYVFLAAILYRHRYGKGEAILSELLNKNDPESASIFAMNQDVSRKKQILKVFRWEFAKWKRAGFDSYWRGLPWYFLKALADWKDPDVYALLRECYSVIDKGGDNDPSYARALASHGHKEDIAALLTVFKTLKAPRNSKDKDAMGRRVTYAASLIKLGYKDPIVDEVLNLDFDKQHWIDIYTVVLQYCDLRLRESEPMLLRLMAWFDRHKGNRQDEEKLKLVTSTIFALNDIGSKSAAHHAKWALQNRQDLFLSKEDVEFISGILMKDASNAEFVSSIMGGWWPQALQERLRLRKIPTHMHEISGATHDALGVKW
jgi:hypothetical protein